MAVPTPRSVDRHVSGWRQELRSDQWLAEVADAWSRRHLDPAAHRTAYTWLLRSAELPRRAPEQRPNGLLTALAAAGVRGEL